MTDKEKLEKLVAEIERLYHQSLVDENKQAESGLSSAACTSYGKSKVCKELLSFTDSMQEEPQVKESAKIQHINKTCKENSDSLTQEPISDDLEQAIDTYLATYFGGEKEKQEWPFLKKMAIHFAEWQKEQLMKDSVLCGVDGWFINNKRNCRKNGRFYKYYESTITHDKPLPMENGKDYRLITIKEDEK